MCHMPGVMCQVSGVMCHVPYVMCHVSGVRQSGEASPLRVCYQRGLPRLVLKDCLLAFFFKFLQVIKEIILKASVMYFDTLGAIENTKRLLF